MDNRDLEKFNRIGNKEIICELFEGLVYIYLVRGRRFVIVYIYSEVE